MDDKKNTPDQVKPAQPEQGGKMDQPEQPKETKDADGDKNTLEGSAADKNAKTVDALSQNAGSNEARDTAGQDIGQDSDLWQGPIFQVTILQGDARGGDGDGKDGDGKDGDGKSGTAGSGGADASRPMPRPVIRTHQARPPQPQEMPLLPVVDVVVFPSSVTPLYIGREQSMQAVQEAHKNKGPIFVSLQQNPNLEAVRRSEDVHAIGVVCKVVQLFRMSDGTLKALFEGQYRGGLRQLSTTRGYPTVLVERMVEPQADPTHVKAVTDLIREAVEELVRNGQKIGKAAPDTLRPLLAQNNPSLMADTLASRLPITYQQKQKILELLDPAPRLEEVYFHLSNTNTVSILEKRIKMRVREQMDKTQREYYLTEQIKAINKELGRDVDVQEDLNNLEKRLREKDLPEAARQRGLVEVNKLRGMTSMAPEHTILRTYVEWILDLPWNELSPCNIDLARAREILDANHYGIEKPKERILEYLAVQKLSGGVKGPILCLVGPPGVGKTSLARSVAEATGREYLRLSLGGVRDEAEIRGHRRTYIGALPGKIIQSLKRVKYNNPLFCLDEIDKISLSERGDPAAALLEVLDPEQNCTFMDHYLDLDYDLSKIFFITTANSLDTIPGPLRDRMEIIELNSYLETEKFHIARNFLIPRQLEENSIKPENVDIGDDTILSIVRDYTREAGVRTLERRIAKICRRTAVEILEKDDLAYVNHVRPENLNGIFGAPTIRHDRREDNPAIGVCTALAYTPLGGDILFIETSLMPGTGIVSTTGKLGEVMQESAKAAFTYVRAHAPDFGLAQDFHKKVDIHVHVPDGATPKDGPSAGITIATAIASALLGIPARNDVAMTGEISLRGRVLPIGGLREKLLAAKRAGIYTIIVPRANENQVSDVPKDILEDLKIHYVDTFREVLPLALMATEEEIYAGSGRPSISASLREDCETQGADEAKPAPAPVRSRPSAGVNA